MNIQKYLQVFDFWKKKLKWTTKIYIFARNRLKSTFLTKIHLNHEFLSKSVTNPNPEILSKSRNF